MSLFFFVFFKRARNLDKKIQRNPIMRQQNNECHVTVSPPKINQKCSKLKDADYTPCGGVSRKSQMELNKALSVPETLPTRHLKFTTVTSLKHRRRSAESLQRRLA